MMCFFFTTLSCCYCPLLLLPLLLWEMCRGEGMPISKQPGSRGNLIVKFDVAFPRQLNSSQKEQIRSLLPQAV
jgi:hypothetical protein